MKYYIIAGEASGDLHGSNLIRAIHRLDSDADIRCWGGNRMESAGATLVKHYRDLAFMGFIEVVKNLGTILKNLRFCKEDITQYAPDILILIDYPGFNLRIAEWAHKQGIRVAYYISPQVWAWKENRVSRMKACIDKMLVILPFEKEWFRERWNWDVSYVGHPLVEAVEDERQTHPVAAENIIALLPGSRKQEVAKKLPIMLEVSRDFPDYRFVIAQAPSLDREFYGTMTGAYPGVELSAEGTYTLLQRAKAALVTSGTATLETALFHVPEVVCYKGSEISYQIARRLVRVKYISLVNLIMDRLVVKELIQQDLTAANLSRELSALLNDPQHRSRIMEDYRQLTEKLKQEGRASDQAAAEIYSLVNS